MTPSNYHTHTVYCDGRDTPEELVPQFQLVREMLEAYDLP